MENKVSIWMVLLGLIILAIKKFWFYFVIFACYFLYKFYLSDDPEITLLEIIGALIYIEVCKIKEIMKENSIYLKGVSTYAVLRTEGASKAIKEVVDQL